jgi:flagellar biosynthesis/type III secretory pathway protein FliH
VQVPLQRPALSEGGSLLVETKARRTVRGKSGSKDKLNKENINSFVGDCIKEMVWEAAYQKGYREGYQEGYHEGYQEAVQEGKDELMLEIAKKFLEKGLTRQAICEKLDVTEDWLTNINKSINE